MVRAYRRQRTRRPVFAISLLVGGLLLVGSAGLRAYSSVMVAADTPVGDGPATFGHAIEASVAAFDLRWSAGSGGGDALWARRTVNFAWADPADDGISLHPLAAAALAIERLVAGAPAGSVPASASIEDEACLARALYFEARGESRTGQLAVAQVVINRTKVPGFAKTICGVVNQAADSRNGCQFSFTCDGLPDEVTDRRSWNEAVSLAATALASPNGVVLPEVGNSTYYHALSVAPSWAEKMKLVEVIGHHVFYTADARG